MGLFTTRKTRATRRAEARAIMARAKLEARLAAKNEARRIKSAQKSEANAVKAQVKAQRDSDKAALKVAETELKAAREGKLLSPTRIRRVLTVSRLLAPIVVPLVYRAAIAARAFIDERRADRLGVPLSQVGQFSGHGAQLSARIAGAEKSLRAVAEKKPKDAETKQFVAAMTERLGDLGGGDGLRIAREPQIMGGVVVGREPVPRVRPPHRADDLDRPGNLAVGAQFRILPALRHEAAVDHDDAAA